MAQKFGNRNKKKQNRPLLGEGNFMGLEINYLRVFRDVCDNSELSLGALGVLSFVFFKHFQKVGIEELNDSSSDSIEDILKYINELKDKDYFLDDR